MKLIGGGRLPFGQFLRRLYRAYQDDLLFDCAAQLSYYFLFSLFPFLFFLVALTAYLPIAEVLEQLIPQLRALAPVQVADFVEQNARATFSQQRPSLLVLSLLAAVFSASRGIDAIRRVLNLAYDVKESRPFWKTELIAVGITIAGAASVLSGLAILVVGGEVGFWLAERAHIEWAFVVLVQQLRWPVTGLLIALLVATAYHLLPDVEQRMRFMVPGSIAATALWLMATWAFGEYVAAFNSYNVTYGSLGGMVVLLVWLYLSGFVFVLGGAINAVLEHASASGKARGARSEREASPPTAARPSAVPPGAVASAAVAKRSAGEEHANPDNA